MKFWKIISKKTCAIIIPAKIIATFVNFNFCLNLTQIVKNGFEISSFVRFVRMIEISTVLFLYLYNNQEPIIFIIVIMIIMSNERSEDSYIDLAVFFQEKS